MRVLWVVAVALLAVPGASAALNHARPYEQVTAYQHGTADAAQRFVSGKFDDRGGPASGTFGFQNSTGTSIDLLERVCWGPTGSRCAEAAAGALVVRAAPGSSFGIKAPVAVTYRASADHGMARFVDFAGDTSFAAFGLGPSLVVGTVGGDFSFETWPLVSGAGSPADQWAALAGTDEDSAIEVVQAGLVLDTVRGKAPPVYFVGTPRISLIAAEGFVAPFGAGDAIEFTRASPKDARVGLKLDKLDQLLSETQGPSPSSSAETPFGDSPGEGLSGLGELLPLVLGGAILGFETGEDASAIQFALVRFKALEVRSNGATLSWTGRSPLAIEDGHVEGATKLIGIPFFGMPWWSYALWAVALVLFIVRLVLKPDKTHPRWSKLRWVGWVAGFAIGMLAVFLWDLETRAIWGASILHRGGAGGIALLLIVALQLAPLFAVLFAVAWPLRSILKSSFRLAKQGKFMGLHGPLGNLFGFLLGAHLIRSYLDLYIAQVMRALGG